MSSTGGDPTKISKYILKVYIGYGVLDMLSNEYFFCILWVFVFVKTTPLGASFFEIVLYYCCCVEGCVSPFSIVTMPTGVRIKSPTMGNKEKRILKRDVVVSLEVFSPNAEDGFVFGCEICFIWYSLLVTGGDDILFTVKRAIDHPTSESGSIPRPIMIIRIPFFLRVIKNGIYFNERIDPSFL